MLEDHVRDDRPYDVRLRSLHTFMVRKQTMRGHADSSDIADMERSGLIGTVLDEKNRGVFTGRIPELIASELSREIAAELVDRMGDDEQDRDAANWLVGIFEKIRVGLVNVGFVEGLVIVIVIVIVCHRREDAFQFGAQMPGDRREYHGVGQVVALCPLRRRELLQLRQLVQSDLEDFRLAIEAVGIIARAEGPIEGAPVLHFQEGLQPILVVIRHGVRFIMPALDPAPIREAEVGPVRILSTPTTVERIEPYLRVRCRADLEDEELAGPCAQSVSASL